MIPSTTHPCHWAAAELMLSSVAEDSIGGEYNALVPSGELPSRALTSCMVVAEDSGGMLELRDLESLDAESPPPVEVVGHVTRLAEDGSPVLDIPPGPLVRLCGVTEWSVEYDDLAVTVWVSTTTADYKLISAAPLYEALWQELQCKTTLAARVIALLQEDPTVTFKALQRQCIRCNAIPNAMQFRAEELLVHGHFLVEQVLAAAAFASIYLVPNGVSHLDLSCTKWSVPP